MLLQGRPAPLESAGSRGTSVMCVALRTRSAAACCWRCIHSRCCCRFRSSCCGRRWSAATLPTRVLLLAPGCRRCILSGWCFLVQISCNGTSAGEGCVRRVARASAARTAPVMVLVGAHAFLPPFREAARTAPAGSAPQVGRGRGGRVCRPRQWQRSRRRGRSSDPMTGPASAVVRRVPCPPRTRLGGSSPPQRRLADHVAHEPPVLCNHNTPLCDLSRDL